jgi:RNA polymerase sigma-70 factor (family 1)
MTASLLQLWFDTENGGDDATGRGRSVQARQSFRVSAVSGPSISPPGITEFEELYRDRFGALCDYAYTFLRSRDEARDVVQDVFIRLWDRRAEVWARGEPLPYLVTATRNSALNVLRRRTIEGRYVDDVTRQTDGEIGSRTDNDAKMGASDDLLDRVYEFIEMLPARSREVLLLRWRHGLSLEQIAATMGIGVASVRVAHTRALTVLRERLGVR